MAKIVYASLVSNVSGKVGATVFQRGPGGAMIRAASHTRPRQSAKAQDARRCMSEASQLWRDLDSVTRAMWASIGRIYDPTSAGPGLAFALGRRAFIRYVYQFLHFNRTPPTSPTSWPFRDQTSAELAWDPDSQGMFMWWRGIGGATVDYRIWLQTAPGWPHYSPRSPWLLAYDTATMPRQTTLPGTSPPIWALDPAYFAPFVRYGVTSFWRLKFTGIDTSDKVFSFEDGTASLVFP